MQRSNYPIAPSRSRPRHALTVTVFITKLFAALPVLLLEPLVIVLVLAAARGRP